MKAKYSILFLFALLLQNSCKDDVEIKNFYPMNIGTSWNYETTRYFSCYDSVGKFVELFHTYALKKTIIKKDTIVNSLKLRQFVTTHYENPNPYNDALYYKEEKDGLKLYGESYYNGVSSLTIIIDSIANYNFSSNKKSVNPESKVKKDLSSNFIFYKTPIVEIKYPIIENSEWGYYGGQLKRVIKKDTLYINNNPFSCYKFEIVDPYYEYYYEWISESGLLQYEFQTSLTNWIDNDVIIGKIKTHEIMKVTSMTIK